MNRIEILKDGYGSGYIPSRRTIILACERYVNEIPEEDLHKQYADTLTHEFIHYLLHTKFNLTISKLFDTVEQHFRMYPDIIGNLYKGISWHDWIRRNGYEAFHKRYHITIEDMDKAKEVANRR